MPVLSGALCQIALLLPLLLTGAAGSAAQPSDGLVPAVHVLAFDDQAYRLAAESGFERLVQVFAWCDIEPTSGEWHWQQPDFTVRAADYYGLGLIIRLDHPPDWALRPAADDGPPIDLDAYAGFVTAVAQRYRGQVQGYVIWNEPNLSLEWAGQSPDPAAYTALLCRAYTALKATDPEAAVVSAGLAPTNGGDGALDDRTFLAGMYEAGAAACFDVLGAHAYGFGHPPDDPRGEHSGLNLARLLDIRELMSANHDDDAAVWITELGWRTDAPPTDAWQVVSEEQQASCLESAWQHIAAHWPWVQVLTVWNLSWDLHADDEMAGYSLLERDGSPKAALHTMRQVLARERGFGWADWIQRLPEVLRQALAPEVVVLAADEVVHLGDNQ